ncbi:hypothetical protein [Nocardia carnea]|uniref:hypothetical protein n=1 Tax=Nocardia carnea TaxID=37328 RepID=UPI002457B643|nr:hypothetical protein [Nocardia carnea]
MRGPVGWCGTVAQRVRPAQRSIRNTGGRSFIGYPELILHRRREVKALAAKNGS